MSTTTYCQPWALSLAAMKSALALVCASVTVVPKQSQLFQPMGGVAAQAWKSGTGAAEADRVADRSVSAVSAERARPSARRLIGSWVMCGFIRKGIEKCVDRVARRRFGRLRSRQNAYFV